MILQAIKAFALLGGDWVLYILIVLSVWSIKVILERFFLFRARAKEEQLGEPGTGPYCQGANEGSPGAGGKSLLA